MKLQGQGILITGASQGLGRVIAKACVAEGAHVFICARSAPLLEETRSELARNAKPGQKVFAETADVSRPADVERLVKSALASMPRVDGLVNNAGIYGPIGRLEDVPWDEWTRALEINLMGTALPCRAVLPIFRKEGRGKIVNLSGGGATAPLPHFSAYAAAKAAVVRLTETLAHETKDARIDVNAIAPGALNTRLLDEVIAAGPGRAGEAFHKRSLEQKREGGVALEKGAALCVFLLSTKSDGITGRILSAVWDPWEKLPEHREELDHGDVYTLRRIVPGDRGLQWGQS